jgi:hypothetical protein
VTTGKSRGDSGDYSGDYSGDSSVDSGRDTNGDCTVVETDSSGISRCYDSSYSSADNGREWWTAMAATNSRCGNL